jgi:hypothetical protein
MKRLREEWPTKYIEPRTPAPSETLEAIYMTDDALLADVLKQHLEARGILAILRNPQHIGRGMYGSYHVMVPSVDAKRGKSVVTWLLAEEAE